MHASDNTFLRLFTTCFVLTISSAHPYGDASANIGSQSGTSIGWLDLFSPSFPPVEKKKTCVYKESTFEEGALVATDEPCLKCRCLRGSLVCYLRVCPLLPDPPPPTCVLLLRHGACCSELICEDGAISTNHISRSEPSSGFPVNNTAFGDGCIVNGTLYASGSAMWTDRRCEYCYCIGGKERCVQPRCLPPPKDCTPRRAPHACCPVRYDCDNDLATTSTTILPDGNRENGCEVDGIFYPEGEKITSIAKSPCDNCFCMRQMVRCVPLSCAPPLLGCTPNILPGECCASSYNCSNQFTDTNFGNELFLSSEDRRKSIEDGNIISERSFPDDTPLTPSQIAEILLNGDGRNYRRIEAKKNETLTVVESDSDDITTETMTTVDIETTTDVVNNSLIDDVMSKSNVENVMNSLKNDSSSIITLDNNVKEVLNLTSESKTNTSDSIDVPKSSDADRLSSNLNISESDALIADGSKTIINDTVNCTTEISSFDGNITNKVVNKNSSDVVTYDDIQERLSSSSINGENLTDSINSESKFSNSTSKENVTDILTIGSKFPSTSLIIPKDDDIFMVNVSTYVTTNTSVVTLRPVAAIPPEIEAILNISLKKNNQKDDFYDYDYKSSLPPSLPNLQIIPFLAIDAVLKSDEIEREKNKEKEHSTTYPFNPTTFPPYVDDNKYLGSATSFPSLHLANFNRNPIIYKQHINDKFQATTYQTILNDKYDGMPYDIEKYDPTVYPSLTAGDSQTENPAFAFDAHTHNLFSPPIETEGGFLPREPPLLDSYYNMGYPTQPDVANPVTDPTIMVTDRAKINSDDCVSNGRKYKNGELITEPNACVVCFCYYGDIHCQDPECPPIKLGCRRIVEKGENSCCGVEICNEQKEKNSSPNDSKIQSPHNVATISDRIDTPDPFKDVIRTEPAPDLQSLIVDMMPYYSSTSSTTKKPTTTATSTTDQTPDQIIIKSTTSKPSIVVTTQESISETTPTVLRPEYKPQLFNSLTNYEAKTEKEDLSFYHMNPIETTIMPEELDEDADDGFSFDSVLKLLLGDSSDTTTKPPATRITKRYTPTTSKYTTTISPTRSTKFTPLPSTTPKISTTTNPPYKNTHKYSYLKPNRTTNPSNLLHKNYTKLSKSTTRQPLVYPMTRPAKFKYTSTSTTPSTTTQAADKISFSPLPPVTVTEAPKPSFQKKPTTVAIDPASPFGGGLLKLAGCNIYGRMYRVGRIISELSGPCLECMCTEIGVECKALTC